MNTTTRRAWRLGAACALACQLAACGGGGGGSDNGGGASNPPTQLFADYRQAAGIFQPSTVHPLLDGTQGHAPHCTLEGGHLPNGLTLNTDCTITGTATEFGAFPLQVHLTLVGSDKNIYFQPNFIVAGPRAEYRFDRAYTQGTTLDVAPEADASFTENWTPAPGMTVVYSVDAGTLPAGAQLDAATGRVQGTVTTPGVVDAIIGAHVSYGGQSAVETSRAQFSVNPVALANVYHQTNVYQGDPFVIDATPPALPGATFTYALTADANHPLTSPITIDPATGRISGVILDDVFNALQTVTITMDYAGQHTTTPVMLPVVWDEPVDVQYPVTPNGSVGQPYSVAPIITVRDTQRTLGDYHFEFTVPYPFQLPPGLAIDPATGVISGAASQRSCTSIRPRVKVTVGGGSFYIQQRIGYVNLEILDAQGNCG